MDSVANDKVGLSSIFFFCEYMYINNHNEALANSDLTMTTIKTEIIFASPIFGLCFIGYGFYFLYFKLLVLLQYIYCIYNFEAKQMFENLIFVYSYYFYLKLCSHHQPTEMCHSCRSRSRTSLDLLYKHRAR